MTFTVKGPEPVVSAIAWAIDQDISAYVNTINSETSDLDIEKHKGIAIGYRIDEPQLLPFLQVRLADEADFIHEGALFALGEYDVVASYYIADNDPYNLWKRRARSQRALIQAVYNNTSLSSAYPAVLLGYMSPPQIPPGEGTDLEQGAWIGMTSVVFHVTQDE